MLLGFAGKFQVAVDVFVEAAKQKSNLFRLREEAE